ncbi:hypothetical protein DI272_25125 [Streptomyces sp. Act143]|uniref:hypothetical protein n=1 Tax=Streptomyces sp. Act143 TaxID=2200760 RepID=UPI000D683258|nr:hypothetical protein [Streptomyces sp. Act143]PWI17078.1 hypothetical protein DI272_25125 [Streptomyces sp. Act143]
MSTKTTFEDRLLAELRHEIGLREAAAPAVAFVARRALVTRGRLVLAAGACAAAGLAVVLVPGSPADAPAYAVEQHDDGSVTLTIEDMSLAPDDQHRLAERLRAQGIHVAIDEVPAGEQCAQPRGELLPSYFEGHSAGKPRSAEGGQGAPEGVTVLKGTFKTTLNPGDSLAFENTKESQGAKSGLRLASVYAVSGEIAACEPVRMEPHP